jgi:uncharacterized protein (TIGR03503 family)
MPQFKQVVAWMLLLVWANATAAVASPLPDTRVLIDISGSMRQNDPKNLRRPALRLLVNLLPKDSRAGVWTFGQYVNMLVPLGNVDRAWREKARLGAAKIHSRGLFTHIEDVLRRASEDWTGEDGAHARHLILLTDGMVDVSKDAEESARSRQRVLDQQLPRLKQKGVKIHTVALSDRADHDLMARLSRDSGGWYEQVESAAGLQKVFLRIFEKVGNPDTLPLKDNRFRVDSSVSELTLIVFRSEEAPPTRIEMPTGQAFGQSDAPAFVRWHRDEGYDLLTVAQPAPGEWRIQAQIDPDNRVMVLTDLRMLVSELPNRLVAGQRLPMVVSFAEQGKVVTRRELIDVITLTAEQIGPQGAEFEPQPVRDDGEGDDPVAYDGKFEFHFQPREHTGHAELVVTAEGKTFERDKRRIFELFAPATLSLEMEPETSLLGLEVRPVEAVIDAASLEAVAALESRLGIAPVPLKRGPEGVLRGTLDPSGIAGEGRLSVKIRARTPDGEPVATALPALTVQGELAVAAPNPPTPEPASTAVPESAQDGLDTASLLIGFGVVNLVLLLAGIGAFWLLRRRAIADEFRLVDDPPAAADGSAAAAEEAAA